MDRRVAWCLWLGFLGVGSPLIGQGTSAGQSVDQRIEKMFADWQKRRDRIQTVHYRVRGECVIPKGSIKDPDSREKTMFPPRDVRCGIERAILVDFPTNRHRLEVEDQQYDQRTDQLFTEATVTVFDGSHFQGWTPRDKNTGAAKRAPVDPDVVISSGDMEVASFELIHWPLFIGHGVIATLEGEIVPGKLEVPADKEMFFVHGHGVHHGRPCLVVRTRARANPRIVFDEFWIDAERDSAVVRQSQCRDGKPLLDFDIQYRKTSHGWLPESWTFTDATSGQINFVEHVRVDELTINPAVSDADFRIDIKPGMLVEKNRYGKLAKSSDGHVQKEKGDFYRVGSDGTWNEVVIQDGVERSPRAFWGWLAVAALIGVSVGGWFTRRWIVKFIPRRA